MILSVRELELHKIPFDVEIAPGKLEFEDGLIQATPVAAKGVAELVSDVLGDIRVKGNVKVRMECPCDRCLETASFPVNADFDLFYRPDEPGTVPVGEVHVTEGESEIGFYEGDGLELEGILLEQIVLALPMQKLCKADCKGICPVCGQNRNLAACACQVKPVDNRWAALENLKSK